MIRYIHIGDAINEDSDEFAFHNTVDGKWFGPYADLAALEQDCDDPAMLARMKTQMENAQKLALGEEL